MFGFVTRRSFVGAAAAVAFSLTAFAASAQTPTGEPIRIGFGMSLTGPLAANGKSALLAMKIWEEDTNAKGGLLGRPVKLVYYDDQTNPSTVPGLYTKLIDVDKVDLVIGGYATNMLAPAMPLMMQKKMTFIGLYGLGVNSEFNYDRFFVMMPTGQDPKKALSRGFFDLAMKQDPKPKTVAIVAADAEFSKNAADGARDNAKAAGLKIVYDRSYPPSTTDYAPIVRAIQAANADIVFVGSYPLDSVGLIRAANEIGLKPKLFGGSMVGLQATTFKTQLGPLLNGVVMYDFWQPTAQLSTPAALEMLKKYQARAGAEGVDPLGYYMAPYGYAYIELLGKAVEGTKSLDQGKIADYIRNNTHKLIVGDVKFGKAGEWADERVVHVQFQNIKGNGLDQFRDVSTQVVVAPPAFESGKLIYPYEKAKN
ncbi:amino acid ABC transporter substrate-binding protein [Pseudorhodoplanes sinuspersici]|uniref:Branched-chain amino acid ABC transporter substrate-binding protein n=1 Tax=Pseudorhodoplanes sinuspersici TaxID=1235591 RepID=A0A1W6ZNI1_9HYPH|nr:amino acid ABC transporter substrate-binding protein [Pseudorhodoplanes sinuspersici]ARP98700.1 branched-chain amino acid ABC transporter substrate-binding protein [Pseudorhodoplanes sinuspersici]RKE69702.1 amino acid/amide ABC transporter substrate-binding protein (HAAT family) [Pseudorhodoplanes sinuspersici]